MTDLPLVGSIFLLLNGPGNVTYRGVLHVRTANGINEVTNTNNIQPISGNVIFYNNVNTSNATDNKNQTMIPPYDHRGASSYVIAVVMVYGISIVLLIGSHINRRHDKIAEDKQVFSIKYDVHFNDSYEYKNFSAHPSRFRPINTNTIARY